MGCCIMFRVVVSVVEFAFHPVYFELVLVSRDIVAEVEMPRRSTAGTWYGQVRAVRIYFDNHIRFIA